ncbi:methyltransferase domain-containing protein [Actinoplanes hulinensis]|uniref:Methyltransferase domain-containing protein n=1 Tax=Actinoplanes hulinensis TaxID=1144547 RepID=A0ABS7B3B7_9ACTN|nr:class I SAM-dependent methyltransferase [Actinoplanes hulinensis]MBW6435289.1 methyltransferase domain-containing protein [Actinoplanes hulinensis]
MTTASFDAYERSMWAGRAEIFNETMAHLCGHTAPALLSVAAGDRDLAGLRLLDVGTGSGTVAGLADERGARVTAVDAEPSMVELAAKRVPGAEVRQAILPELPFPDGTFDAAVANFVINHVGDPAAAVAGMRRVVRPGGRIAVTIWPHPKPEAQRLWDEIFDAAGAVRPDGLPRLDPALDFRRDEAGLTALLSGAGLTGVTCTTISWTMRIDAGAWWSGPAAGIGLTGLILAAQDEPTAIRVRQEFERRTAPYRGPDGVLAVPTAALLAAGAV